MIDSSILLQSVSEETEAADESGKVHAIGDQIIQGINQFSLTETDHDNPHDFMRSVLSTIQEFTKNKLAACRTLAACRLELSGVFFLFL